MAMTADGKIATANRRITSFSSPRDLDHLYELRSTVDAVMCGARTIVESQATLDPGPMRFRRRRLNRGLAEHNLRVAVSGSASLANHAARLRPGASPWIVLATRRAAPTRLQRLRRLGTTPGLFGERVLDLHAALSWLRREWNVERLLCEGGARLNAALFAAQLVDELHLTICPTLFGGATAPTLAANDSRPLMDEATPAVLQSRRVHGNELYLVYRIMRLPPELPPSAP